VQQPHPPMFAACTKPESAVAVGKLGLGALNFAFGNDEYLTQKVSDYRAAVGAAQPIGRKKNDWFACTPAALVLDDDRKACAYGLRGARFFAESLAAYYLAGSRPTGRLPVSRDFLSDADLDDAMASRNQPGTQVAAIVGDAAAARETVARFVDIGVDELILVMQMGTVPHELIMASIKTFGEKVLPHFAT
jgi:alkanesulfonate monooxygenase SsuD/methylene tetrahydromethanopterin reductase-like flavin-dependent oxidoreductase (luciferase family)